MTETHDFNDTNDPTEPLGASDATGAPPDAPTADAPTDNGDGAVDAIAHLTRRMNVLVGLLGLLLVGAFAVIGLLFSRVADAEAEATAARTELAAYAVTGGASSDDLDEIRADLERVEAGAALYASQITGFQEQLVELEPQVSAGIGEAITGLSDFADSTIAFDVNIDEVIPIETEVVLDRVVEVPIKTTIPIKESFDTTIRINTGIGSIPLDVTVPVDIEVPVDLVVEIPINETIQIKEEFPVQLDIPIEIEVRETELGNLADSLGAGLQALQDVLTGLG